MVKNKATARLCCIFLVWSRLSLSLSLADLVLSRLVLRVSLSPSPFILRVPLDPAGVQPRQLSPSPPAFNLFQHQGLFKWLSSLYQVAQVLEFQLQHQSFQWIIPLHIAIVIYSSHHLHMGMNTYISFKTNHYICVIKAWLHFWCLGADSCLAPLLPCIWASSLFWFQWQVENTNLTCGHPHPSPNPKLQ